MHTLWMKYDSLYLYTEISEFPVLSLQGTKGSANISSASNLYDIIGEWKVKIWDVYVIYKWERHSRSYHKCVMMTQ